MTLSSRFHPGARLELYAAIDWYDERGAGLGERFEDAVLDALGTLTVWPDAGRAWLEADEPGTVRMLGVPGFSQVLVYTVADEVLTVLAVAHEARQPGYWLDRLGNSEHDS